MMKFSVKDVICFMVLGIVSGCGASGSGVDSGSAANTVSLAGTSYTAEDFSDLAWEYRRTKDNIDFDKVSRLVKERNTEELMRYIQDLHDKTVAPSDRGLILYYILENMDLQYIDIRVDVYYYLNGINGEMGWLLNKEMVKVKDDYWINGVKRDLPIILDKENFKNRYSDAEKIYNYKNVRLVYKGIKEAADAIKNAPGEEEIKETVSSKVDQFLGIFGY